jgi:polysaccharide chain length determinant protein (PEP-CTERM system associated)
MEHTAHALDYVSALRRRKWWLIVPLVGAIAIGAALVALLPKQYRAEATLGVSAPSVSPTLVNQTALLDNQERLRALQLQLLSDTVLTRVAAEEGMGTGESAQPLVNDLRNNVKINVPDPVARTLDDSRRLDAFRITYAAADPVWAARVTNRLANVFVDENSKMRTSTAERSSEYLEAERQRAHARLTDLEGKLRVAKEGYMGRLPEQAQANLQTLAGLRQQLELNGTSLRHQQERLSMIQRQLELMEKDAAKGITVTGGIGAAPDRVATLEAQLAVARSTYTDKHPEVQRLDAELKQALQEAVAPQPRANVDHTARLQVDPAYRQLQSERQSATMAIRELEHSGATLRSQMAEYQRRVEAAPMVEQELAAVQREYDLAQRAYADLSSRVATASLAENVARNRDSEQFTVIYPASVPAEPVSPIPSRVMLIALIAGICLGGALALAREYLDPSVHSTRDLTDEFDLPVLGEVAHVPAASR